MKHIYILISLILLLTLPFLQNQANVPENISGEASMQKVGNLKDDEPKCSDCHSDITGRKVVHDPASESCENCHQVNLKAHAENGELGLKLTEIIPQLCFDCHDDLKSNLDTISQVHQAVNNGKLCMNCHSPHSSDQKKLLVSEEKKLCLSCHNKSVSPEGKKLVNMAQLLAGKKNIHAPIESDGCVVCHQPHGSSNNFLLKGAFPRGNYAQAKRDNFAFCWECHDSDLLEVAVTASKTNFRDGGKNLHYVHRTGKNGRTCVVCHNVHASKNLHLIEDKVQFNNWEMPIRYKPTQNGGSCFPGCHSEKSYTR
jgi:predicted CXXCH cytochrome family protein